MTRLLGLALLLGLTGCALGPRSAQVDLSQLPAPTQVWLTDDTAVVRFELPGGESIYAAAGWQPRAMAFRDYEHVMATLEPLDDEWPAGVPEPEQFDQYPVRQQSEWNDLLARAMGELVPAKPNQGVTLLVQRKDSVVYRDAEGKLQLSWNSNRPEQVEVVDSQTRPVFLEEAAGVLEDYLEQSSAGTSRFVFRSTSVARPGQQFIMVDVRRQQVVSFISPLPVEGGDPLGLLGLPVRGTASILLRSHALTLIKNPFTSLGRLVNFALHTSISFVRPLSWGDGAAPPISQRPGMDLAAWEQALDEMNMPPRYQGQLEPLIDGDAYFSRLVADVNNASESVDIRVYIFDNDDYAVTIAELLKARSADVRVRVLLDDLGSLGAGVLSPASLPADFIPPEDIVAFLEDASNINVRRTSNPWLTADHTKVNVIDGKVAYVGGMNIGREYRYEWHDLMVRLEGPIVDRLQQDFDGAWAHAGPAGDLAFGLEALTSFDPKTGDPANGIGIRPLYTGTGVTQILDAKLAAIERAQSYIYIQNAYLSENAILAALAAARQRGVDVRVILPTENDSGIMAAANLVSANALISHGVKVYAYPGMTHVKATIIDGWACLGSANFDKLSFYINQETNIAFSDPDTVQRLRQELFERDFQISSQIDQPIKAGWSDHLFDLLANQL